MTCAQWETGSERLVDRGLSNRSESQGRRLHASEEKARPGGLPKATDVEQRSAEPRPCTARLLGEGALSHSPTGALSLLRSNIWKLPLPHSLHSVPQRTDTTKTRDSPQPNVYVLQTNPGEQPRKQPRTLPGPLVLSTPTAFRMPSGGGGVIFLLPGNTHGVIPPPAS